MNDVPLFGRGMVVGGVSRLVASLPSCSDADAAKCHVDVNTEKLRRLREEEEREEQQRAQLEYAKHVRNIHPDKQLQFDFDVEDGEEIVEEPAAKRPRGMEQPTDENWFVEASPEASKGPGVPVMYTWEKEFESLRELGESDTPDKCFGCEYMAVAAHETIYADDWRAVVEFFQASLPMCPGPRHLGAELYAFFDRTVVESLRKRGVMQPDARLWSPHGILDHFMNHNRDPVVQMMRDYMAYTEIHATIIKNQIFELHPESGRRRVNGEALKMLKTIGEMREKLMRANPHQLPYAAKETSSAPTFVHPHSQMKQRPSLIEAHSRWDR